MLGFEYLFHIQIQTYSTLVNKIYTASCLRLGSIKFGTRGGRAHFTYTSRAIHRVPFSKADVRELSVIL